MASELKAPQMPITLLRTVLGDADGVCIAGDLEEAFQRNVVLRGRAYALRMCWAECARSFLPLAMFAVRERRGAIAAAAGAALAAYGVRSLIAHLLYTVGMYTSLIPTLVTFLCACGLAYAFRKARITAALLFGIIVAIVRSCFLVYAEHEPHFPALSVCASVSAALAGAWLVSALPYLFKNQRMTPPALR